MGGAPENTVAWIGWGLERGVDALHVNPQLTADGRYVLMHDSTLNRMTDVEAVYPEGPPGGPGRDERGGADYVRDYTLAEIGALRITGEDGTRHRVPALEEAIAAAEGRATLVLGLKAYEVESLAAALRGRVDADILLMELYVSGTDQSKLRALADATGLGVMATLYQTRDALKDLDGIYRQIGPALRAVTVTQRRVTPDFLARARDLGVAVLVSGWSGREDLALIEDGDAGPWRAALAGVAGAITDAPDRLLTALGR